MYIILHLHHGAARNHIGSYSGFYVNFWGWCSHVVFHHLRIDHPRRDGYSLAIGEFRVPYFGVLITRILLLAKVLY